ncbi:hypothetical protein BB561_005609 [Smittium simulii]|uniref:Uncharacterized protein n=1 Tax=Smittium simulii TaxID=133385 RepID=A0A2T9Y9J2_9FUNG|nr:hypothetical protein BB561_005609 [Smittium simulii]
MNSFNSTAKKLDLTQLLLAHIALSLLGALTDIPTYNLAIYLYGLVVSQQTSFLPKQLKQLAVLLSATLILDIIWLLVTKASFSSSIIMILGGILKPFTVATAAQALATEGFQSSGLSFRDDEDYEQLDEEDATAIGINQLNNN